MGKARKSGLAWLLDFLLEHWPYVVIGTGSLIMAWLARLATFLQPYGAVAWGAVGIVTALVLAAMFLLGSLAYRYLVLTRYEVRRAEATTTNPLASYFSKQRLRLADFFHPFFKATTAAKFEDCELLGPAAVALMGGQFRHFGFVNCEVVIVKDGANVQGVTAFENCIFERCKFFGVTLFMTKEQYLSMKTQGAAPPVISDGTAGQL